MKALDFTADAYQDQEQWRSATEARPPWTGKVTTNFRAAMEHKGLPYLPPQLEQVTVDPSNVAGHWQNKTPW